MKIINTITLLAVAFFSFKALAFGTFLNSSDILTGNEYDLSGSGQFFSSDRRGTHVFGTADFPLSDKTNLRFSAGVGSLDFSLGGSLKWVPHLEDREHPFNFGTVFSSEYARDSSIDIFLFRASPFVSKHLDWEHGKLEPYISVPVGLAAVDSTSRFTSQFILGSRIKFDSLNYISFAVEGGFEIKNAESYIAFMTTFQLRK